MDEATLMLARIAQGRNIRMLMEVLQQILQQVTLRFDERGVAIKCMTNNKCCFVAVDLEGGKFEWYGCTEALSMGFQTADLAKLLKSCGPKDVVSLAVERKSPHIMVVRVEKFDTRTVITSRLNSMDTDVVQVEQNRKLTYSCRGVMSSTQLKEICRDASQIGEWLAIEAAGRSLTFKVEGDTLWQEIEVGEMVNGMQLMQAPAEPQRNCYNLTFLTTLTKASSMSDTVEIRISNGAPLSLVYQVGDLGQLTAIIAARA